MGNFFNALVSQEHCDNIRNSALHMGVSSTNIFFEQLPRNVSLVKISILFNSNEILKEFLRCIKLLNPCFLEIL